MRLRNLGIYVLPDGKEYVADALNAGAYALVPTGLWEVFRFADYRVNADGRLLRVRLIGNRRARTGRMRSG